MAITNKPVRIAIDSIFFNMPYSGISRVWEGILSHIELDFDSLEVELILLIRGKDIPKNIARSGFHTRFPSSKIIHINEFAYPIMQQDVDYLNQLAHQHQWDYFISTYMTYCNVIPNILVVHDMIPETCNLVINHMWIQKDLAIRNASQFICISDTTKHDLIRIYPYLATEAYPITVIHNSITMEPNLADTPDADQFYQNILISRGIQSKRYILTMATNQEAYKNQSLIKSLLDKYQSQLAQKLGCPVPLIVITKNIHYMYYI
jgi:glycosyltransferase involved in cell wall biosynthesis